jgi:hypothetical protein
MMPQAYALTAKWVRGVYLQDSEAQGERVMQELESETGTDVLVLDWTVDAAKRCGMPYLFNAMSGDHKILSSTLMRTTAPYEVLPILARLHQRGIQPQVVYVDDHCCGAWPPLLQSLWPGAFVRLDTMHAMRRLTQTTSSTRHQWHGEFCGALSAAIYTFDEGELRRFRAAWTRDGRTSAVPTHILKKYVPRLLTEPARIVAAIDELLRQYTVKIHPDMGGLLTPATVHAWSSLKGHLLDGCLCDPPGVQLNKYGERLSIGGEEFREIASKRGTSALEGFHLHQKQWLGPLATHSVVAGTALLRDGALRWNRKRQLDAHRPLSSTCQIYDADLVADISC